SPPTGALSHFDLARKDCLGTARNTSSKVWYTVANGVLSDVYYPTVDNTNVETLQYVVTDGSTFTDLQTRDMTYAVEALPESGGMACTVTATAKSGKYRIETQYVTDPGRNTVLMRVRMTPADAGYHLYVRFDPSVNGNRRGGGGNGWVVQTASVSLGDGVGVLALGFGTSRGNAVGAAEGSLGTSFEKTLASYRQGWKAYDGGLIDPRTEKLAGVKGGDRRQLDDEY